MTDRQRDLVQNTWEYVLPLADIAVELFYAELFRRDPSLRDFIGDKLSAQKRILVPGFAILVRGLDGIFSVSRQPIEIEGLEANLAWRTPLPGLALSAGYADLQGQTDTADADTLVNNDLDGANISPDRLNLAADYASGPFSARVQARFYLSRSFNDAATATDFEGYEVLDAYLGYRTSIGEFSLAVQNLTDEFYITYDSDTVQVTSNDRFYAGRGRTFTLAWRGVF